MRSACPRGIIGEMRHGTVGSCVLVLLIAASCSSGSSGNNTLTVQSVVSATRSEPAMRFSTSVVYLPDPHVVSSSSGELDSKGNAAFRFTFPGVKGGEDNIWSGSKMFTRDRTDALGLSHDWCVQQHLKTSPGPGVAPVDTLAKLHLDGKSLERVGTDRVRGVEAVHYRIVGARPPVDLWVDSKDLLRRLVWAHGDPVQTDTFEYYDYGAPISITLPANAPPCAPFPPPGTCVLGNSFKQLPTCPPTTSTTRP